MSTATIKRPLDQAWRDADDFRLLFPAHSYERWVVAGSVRRGKQEVGDIEHVVIPRVEPVPGSGLFGELIETNLLWKWLDDVIVQDQQAVDAFDVLSKAVYTDKNGRDSYRWGEKYRGVSFRGVKHEIFTATPDNFGNVLVIRTGPAEFSEMMVTRLHSTALRQADGFLKYSDGSIFPCPSEEKYFEACGLPFLPPEKRR